jgi:asparagine N-glycosylation enzyme membrane subunit Stt3
LSDPHKYGNTSTVTQSTANSVISQTTNLGLVAGASYTLDEYVYQGNSSTDANFYGYLNFQSSNEVRLTKIRGTATIGLPLVGESSGVSRIVISKTTPEFQPYTGDILYVENITKTQREDGQAENIKIAVRF